MIHACLSACLAESLEGPSTNNSVLMKSYNDMDEVGKESVKLNKCHLHLYM